MNRKAPLWFMRRFVRVDELNTYALKQGSWYACANHSNCNYYYCYGYDAKKRHWQWGGFIDENEANRMISAPHNPDDLRIFDLYNGVYAYEGKKRESIKAKRQKYITCRVYTMRTTEYKLTEEAYHQAYILGTPLRKRGADYIVEQGIEPKVVSEEYANWDVKGI